MTRDINPKPSGLVFLEVRRKDVQVGDLYANGATVTASRAPRADEGKWARKYTRRMLWLIECGPSFSTCGPATGFVVVGRRPSSTT